MVLVVGAALRLVTAITGWQPPFSVGPCGGDAEYRQNPYDNEPRVGGDSGGSSGGDSGWSADGGWGGGDSGALSSGDPGWSADGGWGGGDSGGSSGDGGPAGAP